MQIKVYSSFSKRQNSTKQPTGGTTVTVNLKYPVDIVNPSFDVSASYAGTNFVYVGDWNRYYYVTGVVYQTNNIVTLKCTSDPMASAKTNIGAVTAPVEFTAPSTNLLVTDPRNRPTFKYEEAETSLLNLTSHGFQSSPGRYIAGFVTDMGLKYYVLTQSNLDTLCQCLFKTSFIGAITNAFFDMKNILVSCIWVPYVPSTLSLLSVITISGEPLTDNDDNVFSGNYIPDANRYVSITDGAQVVAYPFDNDYNVDNYLDAAPYTSGSIYLPFVGVVPFDTDIFFNDKTIDLSMKLDQFTGDLVYELQDSSGAIVATYQGNCATQIPIAGQTSNPVGAVPGALAVIGGAIGIAASLPASYLGGLSLAGLVGGGAAAAGGSGAALASMSHHTQVNGVLSSGVGSQLPMTVYANIRSRKPTETAIETAWQQDNGLMYYKDETISNLSGYVKCSGASVSCSLTPGEIGQINGYLNSGFYYE